MKAEIISQASDIMENRNGLHRYFGWPSVAKLRDGSLMAAASGFRAAHICPFGKVTAVRSYDQGRTWTQPEILLDTYLDDRDAGICPFGEHGVIVTSFNNTIAFQRESGLKTPETAGYLDVVSRIEGAEDLLGSTFIVSNDDGKNFGEVRLSPVSSPHGPLELPDGRILYIGRRFGGRYEDGFAGNQISSVIIDPASGSFEKIGEIPDVDCLKFYEPHAVILPDEKIIVHIRVEGQGLFTTYQSESTDGGRTFTVPHPILEKRGGAPAHLLYHSSGVLISAYGYREAPYGVRVMLSRDGGENWETDLVLYDRGMSGDLGYPCTVELDNKDLLTVFYERTADAAGGIEVSKIRRIVWRITN